MRAVREGFFLAGELQFGTLPCIRSGMLEYRHAKRFTIQSEQIRQRIDACLAQDQSQRA